MMARDDFEKRVLIPRKEFEKRVMISKEEYEKSGHDKARYQNERNSAIQYLSKVLNETPEETHRKFKQATFKESQLALNDPPNKL